MGLFSLGQRLGGSEKEMHLGGLGRGVNTIKIHGTKFPRKATWNNEDSMSILYSILLLNSEENMLIYAADQSYYCMYIFHFISLLFQSLETQWGHYVMVSLILSSPVYRSPTPYACSVPFQVWEGAVVSKRLQTRIPNKKNRKTQSRSSQMEE